MITITDFDSTFVNLLSGIATNLNEGAEYKDNDNINEKDYVDIFKILSNPEQIIVPFLLKDEIINIHIYNKDIDMAHDDLSENSYYVESISDNSVSQNGGNGGNDGDAPAPAATAATTATTIITTAAATAEVIKL